MSVTFSSSKQAATAMSAISEIRADLVVESLKPPDTIGTLQHFSSVSRTFVFCRMCILLSLGQLCEHCHADIPFNILRLYVLQLFINYLLIPVLWQCWFCDRRSICPIKKSHTDNPKRLFFADLRIFPEISWQLTNSRENLYRKFPKFSGQKFYGKITRNILKLRQISGKRLIGELPDTKGGNFSE